MTMNTTPEAPAPDIPVRAFFSYSWDSEQHRAWVSDLAGRLRFDGIETFLDEWHLRPGDQLPFFMETGIRDSSFVLIICTPRYKDKSDRREGGVGYEGNIMTAELFTAGHERKFIPLLRTGDWPEAAPSWLLGKMYIDFRGDHYSEASYSRLLSTLHDTLPHAPAVRSSASTHSPAAVTRQRVYTDFLNAARTVFEAASQRFVFLANRNSPAIPYFAPAIEKKLSDASDRVNDLHQEIGLLSSEPVQKAAANITALALLAKMTSMVLDLKPKFEEAHKQFAGEAIKEFREAIRAEANLR